MTDLQIQFEKEFEWIAQHDKSMFDKDLRGQYIRQTTRDAWIEYQKTKEDKVSHFLK